MMLSLSTLRGGHCALIDECNVITAQDCEIVRQIALVWHEPKFRALFAGAPAETAAPFASAAVQSEPATSGRLSAPAFAPDQSPSEAMS